MDERELRFAADAIRDAGTVVALTGAGVSTASGIPDFRSEGGIWDRYDPMDFHVSRFEADPEGFWTERVAMVEEVYGADVEPNPAHEALAGLERDGHLDALITQNVDGLHQRAGHEEVVEIHGNGDRVVCRDCRSRYDATPFYDTVRESGETPRCPECDGVLKPDVVLFGESLPEHAVFQSHSLAERADLFLVVGSSLTVEPAASLPRRAADTGATLAVVNLEDTGLTGRAAYDFRADVTDVLPRLHGRVVED
ncbi:NAD-dependent deacylase [Salinirubellus salinus]|jgi:NAD-dependent deacetylase|uniref:NAD-dependent deacylase n=1 Tax=Salinirubellus salinus TaxID=1364945 RepID=A0A9E7UC82_9EURY|nr:NAD-dependent deacylase [Salinirubellus salinus]UWM55967.1 NAD-dependent deacylase [Salinirubellus salinus]